MLSAPWFAGAQTLESALTSYLAHSDGNAGSGTIAEWTARHPGELVEAPGDPDPLTDPESAHATKNRKLEGRWCLRSTGAADLGDGVRVVRTALFYPPLVTQIYDGPLPQLPTESGDALRRKGCRLGVVVSEFEGVGDSHPFAEILAGMLPGKPRPGHGDTDANPAKDYWKLEFSTSGRSSYRIFVHDTAVIVPTGTPAAEQAGVLLKWEGGPPGYGQPSADTIDPEVGEPWLALRVAQLAQLPQSATFAMLAFLAPRRGEQGEEPPLICSEQLTPVVRHWLRLADRSAPQQRAAALLLAHEVLGGVDCAEFEETPYSAAFASEDAWHDAKAKLEKGFRALGIETAKSARPFPPEAYAGNLLPKALRLAPTGPVNELVLVAGLDDRCSTPAFTDPDCTEYIQQGESFLARYPADEWTPTVHLLLAEAYSIQAAVSAGDSETPAAEQADLRRKAAAHYRAWYATSKNDRDRALVWQEIWALDAGLSPWLMAPSQMR